MEIKLIGTRSTITLDTGEVKKLYTHDQLGNLLSDLRSMMKLGLVNRLYMIYKRNQDEKLFVFERFTNNVYVPVMGAKEPIILVPFEDRKVNLGFTIEWALYVQPFNLLNRIALEDDFRTIGVKDMKEKDND